MQCSGTEDMLERSYFTLWAFIYPYDPSANAVRLHGRTSNFSSSTTQNSLRLIGLSELDAIEGSGICLAKAPTVSYQSVISHSYKKLLDGTHPLQVRLFPIRARTRAPSVDFFPVLKEVPRSLTELPELTQYQVLVISVSLYFWYSNKNGCITHI